jgi:hypothetical protein
VALRPSGGWGVVFSQVELSPRLVLELPDGIGPDDAEHLLVPAGEAAFYLVGGKLRLALGVERRDGAAQATVSFGLADLNGILYWILRWSG